MPNHHNSDYSPIEPIRFPRINKSLVSINKAPFILPQVKVSGTSEYTTANNSNPLLSDESLVGYQKVGMYSRLNGDPVRFRVSGAAIDVEIYVDSYSATFDPPEGVFPNTAFPDSEVGKLLDKVATYYRSGAVHIFQGISIPEPSQKVWDARYKLCINPAGETVESIDYIPILRGEARSKIEDKELTPDHVIGLGGGNKISSLPPNDSNYSKYNAKLLSLLEELYNAELIPELPKLTTSRITGVEESLVRELVEEDNEFKPSAGGGGRIRPREKPTAGQVASLVAVLDGPYFVEYKMHTFEAPTDDS